jgi:hypothetical protein
MKRTLFAAVLTAAIAGAAELDVGPDKSYRRIEEALKAAAPGDTITVHPLPDGALYTRVALSIETPALTIRAATAQRRIVTPFISPVVQLSATGGSARIYNNIIGDGGGNGRRNQVVAWHDPKVADPRPVEISRNWLSHGFPGARSRLRLRQPLR